MRLAIRYLMTEHCTLQEKVVDTPWVGHGERSGVRYTPDGKKQIVHGSGVGKQLVGPAAFWREGRVRNHPLLRRPTQDGTD